MSKITNDGLTRSGRGCYTPMATVGVKDRVNPNSATKHTKSALKPRSIAPSHAVPSAVVHAKRVSVVTHKRVLSPKMRTFIAQSHALSL